MSIARGILDDAPLEIPCPECGRKAKTTVGESRRNASIRCLGGHTIQVDGSGLDTGVNQVEKRIDDMKRKFG